MKIRVIGGGLAGPEAALTAARLGCEVALYEMRPHRSTEAHQTADFAELVCSNSLKSESENSAPWLLKQEMRRLDSLLLRSANTARVPGGHALTVDRDVFSAEITRAIEAHPNITVKREEVRTLPTDGVVIVASGPLTSEALAEEIARITGAGRLFFYDSISPIVAADSVDMNIAFRASRYGKSLDGTDDYINCPFTKDQYNLFIDELMKAESYQPHIPEDKTPYFEGTYELTYHRRLTDKLGLDLGGRLITADYTSGNLAACQRDDGQYTVTAGLAYALNSHASLNLTSTTDLGRNFQAGVANPDTREYNQQLVSAGMLFRF